MRVSGFLTAVLRASSGLEVRVHSHSCLRGKVSYFASMPPLWCVNIDAVAQRHGYAIISSLRVYIQCRFILLLLHYYMSFS